MAKKSSKEVSEPTAATPVPSRDALQRLSYLYQASVILNNAGLDNSERPRKKRRVVQKQTCEGEVDQEVAGKASQLLEGSEAGIGGETAGEGDVEVLGAEKRAGIASEATRLKQGKGKQALRPVSRHLVRTMKEVAKKATVRMDPGVKRSVCKECDAVLIPGVSASVRIKASGPHAHLIVQTCSTCFAQRRFPAPPHFLDHDISASPTDLTSTDETRIATSDPPTDKKRRRTKREKREQRQAQPPVFFERAGHVVIKGGEVLREDIYGGKE